MLKLLAERIFFIYTLHKFSAIVVKKLLNFVADNSLKALSAVLFFLGKTSFSVFHVSFGFRSFDSLVE